MFFILSKIFAFCIKPIVWIIACFLLSFFLKNDKRKRSFFFTGLILLLLLTNGAIFQGVVNWWEPDPITTKDLEKEYDFSYINDDENEINDIISDDLSIDDIIDLNDSLSN